MDPKLSNLDPKLRDAYNRVMGGSVNNPATPQQSNQTPSNTQVPQAQPNQAYQSTQNLNELNNATAPVYPPPPADPAPGITPPSQFVDSFNPNPSENRETPPDILSQSAKPSVSNPQAPAKEAESTMNAAPPPSAPPDLSTNPATVEPSISNDPTPEAMPSSSSTIAFNAENSSKNIGTTAVKKGGLHILPLAIGMGVILLLLAYTFIWIIIFNVEVPFLPAL